MTFGVDFSFARPGGDALAALGVKFVVRYTPYPGDQGKGLTKAEIVDYHEHGFDIGLVFESTAGRMFDGYPAGVYDAGVCVAARAKLDIPDYVVFYFACDVDTVPAQLAYVEDYMRGVASVFTLARGIYGEYEVVKFAHETGVATHLWQTYAWSGGLTYPYRHLYQYLNGQVINGAEVDYCESYGTDQGLWKAKEDDMPTIQDENFKLVCFLTRTEIVGLRTGEISRVTALSIADERIATVLAAADPMGIQDTLYSHVLAHPGGGTPGAPTLVQHTHQVRFDGSTGDANAS